MTSRTWRALAPAVLALTVAQLAVAAALPDVDRFHDKGFGARLLLYPVMMLAVPAAWWWRRRRRGGPAGPVPWDAFTLVMLPFLVDVTGNSLDLYDAVWWWDDANHLGNWFLLALGLGSFAARAAVARGAVLVLLVGGLGALLAIGWELGEYVAFIRGGTELATAYTDTLGDEALGSLGALAAGAVLAAAVRRRERAAPGT